MHSVPNSPAGSSAGNGACAKLLVDARGFGGDKSRAGHEIARGFRSRPFQHRLTGRRGLRVTIAPAAGIVGQARGAATRYRRDDLERTWRRRYRRRAGSKRCRYSRPGRHRDAQRRRRLYAVRERERCRELQERHRLRAGRMLPSQNVHREERCAGVRRHDVHQGVPRRHDGLRRRLLLRSRPLLGAPRPALSSTRAASFWTGVQFAPSSTCR